MLSFRAQADARALVPQDSVNWRSSEGFDDFDNDEIPYEVSKTPIHSKPRIFIPEVVWSRPQVPPLREETASPSFEGNAEFYYPSRNLRILETSSWVTKTSCCGVCVTWEFFCTHNDPPLGIEGLWIVGDPVLGGRLAACGHLVNGTYLCIFQVFVVLS